MKINILSKKDESVAYADVYIKTGSAPAPFEESMGVVPYQSGLATYIKDKAIRPMQMAGRNMGAYGVFNINLKETDLILNCYSACDFIMGLYDFKHDINIVLPLPLDHIEIVKDRCALLSYYRELANTGASEIWPRNLIENVYGRIKEAAVQKGAQAKLKLIDRQSDEFDELAGLKAVGKGSYHSPCLGIIDFIPEGSDSSDPVHVCLVGKGITFDSGGYNIKTGNYMTTMRTDKSGAVYMAAALHLAILNGLHKRVRLYLPCSENLISGTSMVPGDIIRYANGVSVEVGNTDAEGRLILADALILASKDKPKAIIDAATLTGAAKIAVGRDMTLASSFEHNDLVDLATQCAKEAGEILVYMQSYDFHKRYIKSQRATINNTSHGDGAPGALTATAFLSHFVECDRWLHFDLSSAYCADGSLWYAQGSTGEMIKTISSMLLKI